MYHRDPLEANEYPARGDGRTVPEEKFCERGSARCTEFATVFVHDGHAPHKFCVPCHREWVDGLLRTEESA